MKHLSDSWIAAANLMAEYWRRVDGSSDAPVDELYAENGVMHIGTAHCEGRAQIRAFFEARSRGEAAQRRTTRHLMSNLTIEPAGHGAIRARTTVQVMAGTGDLPLAPGPAVTLADFDDLLREVAPGVWRIERRHARVIFTGAGASSFAR